MNYSQTLLDKACEQWIQDLTDLSRRNNLLYYKDQKVGTLDISKLDEKYLIEFFGGSKVSINDLLSLKDNNADVYRKIKIINKRAKQNLEERGIDTLLLAYGFATWKEDDDASPPRCPLILLPISIESKSKAFLRRSGDAFINPVLLAYLEKRHNLKITSDQLLQDENGSLNEDSVPDFETVVSRLRTLSAKRIQSIQVDKQFIISNFSFQKMSMVEDLKFQKENPNNQTELVLAMAGDEFAIRKIKTSTVEIDPKKFDQIQPEDDFIVFDCDSSQQSVIQAVLKGENCTIQGPPGTGKSQTIANLIATLVANGKKVLFVAEKRAALEVVKRRLDQKNMGHLLLDLHGTGISRKMVLDQFKESLDLIKSFRSIDVGETHKQYVKKRRELNYHVEQFHKKRSPANKSVYELLSALIQFSEAEKSQTKFTGKDLEKLTPDVVDSLRAHLEELQKPSLASLFVNPRASIWQNTNISTVEDGTELSNSVNTIYKQLLFLEQEFSKLGAYGLSDNKNFKEMENMIQLMERVNLMYTLYSDNHDIFHLDTKNFLTIKKAFANDTDLNQGFDYLKQIHRTPDTTPLLVNEKINLLTDISRISDKYSDEIYNIDFDKYIQILSNAESKKWFSNLFDSELKTTVETLKKIRFSEEVSREELLGEIKKISVNLNKWKKLFPQYEFPDMKIIKLLRDNEFFLKVANSDFWKAYESIFNSRNPIAETSSVFFTDIENIANLLKEWKSQHRSTIYPEPVRDWETISSNFAQLQQEIQKIKSRINQNQIEKLGIGEIISIFKELNNDSQALSLGSVKEIEREFNKHNASVFLIEIKQRGIESEFWARQFEYAWLYSCLEEAYKQDGKLKTFHGKTQTELVKEFQELDRERIELTKDRLNYRHARWVMQQMSQFGDEENLVRGETNKNSARLSLRKLLPETPNVLTSLRPCWMASPLSISQLIDAKKQYFDVVIFDEASQIIPADSIPAIMRSKQIVVAGDTKQLPPTDFFRESDDDDDESEEVSHTKGFESLLNRTASFLNERHLVWHYRSRSEELIAFSNENIYANKLITFPSPKNQRVLFHDLIPFEIGQTPEESEEMEVKRVIDLILNHATERPNETLGVITMGIAHAQRIESALEDALKSSMDLEPFFNEEIEDHFFIKNIEQVQGDERDAIILSIGYVKEANGNLPHNFGPLTHQGGERRLNVAITRARKRMTIVSSFRDSDIDLDRSNSEGVRLLKSYLNYAGYGGKPQASYGQEKLNPIEKDIMETLEKNGYTVIPKFGFSQYKIDLVVRHPKKDEFVLAIECDGEYYASSPTVKERDRLREQQLASLGWKFYRVWLLDWINEKESELERIHQAFQEALK
ncbi:MAG TPA: AAA domain-containing protein [Leptospiraceae bacterium]|nr:AAA domain-containing protein [Leptospiraceae bacterium]HMW03731.1 AAA domain-containing protein [Leptospiraceae bacterium]HMX31844.1 AAA domain-containing protein [Leptospiraceae bacterium]HMY29711.1 AAA domain-containing protein [Leptospiraceae bacterium]HMZ64013.1 AAA domain-containing protein [Leptospiraceae bacterium]